MKTATKKFKALTKTEYKLLAALFGGWELVYDRWNSVYFVRPVGSSIIHETIRFGGQKRFDRTYWCDHTFSTLADYYTLKEDKKAELLDIIIGINELKR